MTPTSASALRVGDTWLAVLHPPRRYYDQTPRVVCCDVTRRTAHTAWITIDGADERPYRLGTSAVYNIPDRATEAELQAARDKIERKALLSAIDRTDLNELPIERLRAVVAAMREPWHGS